MNMLMEIDPLPMRGSLVMTMVMISPSQRDVSPTEQLRRSPRLVLPRFRLETAALCLKSFLSIFLGQKTSYSQSWAPEACQVAHEAEGHAQEVGRALHPRGQGVAPLRLILLAIFFINYKTCLHEVSGLLELCRIGL